MKLYNVRYSAELIKKIYFIQHLFQEHIATKSSVRLALFARFAFYNQSIFLVGMAVYICAAISFFPYPFYMYIMHNKRVPLLSMYIPGIDETTFAGYIALISVQTPLMFLAIIGMSSCDIMYAMMLVNTPILARLIEDEIDQMNEMLCANSVKPHVWKYRFRNLLLMHHEMAE